MITEEFVVAFAAALPVIDNVEVMPDVPGANVFVPELLNVRLL